MQWPSIVCPHTRCSAFGMADLILVPSPAASTMTAAGRDALTRSDSLISLTLAERAEPYPRLVQDTFTSPGEVRCQSFWPVSDKPRRPIGRWGTLRCGAVGVARRPRSIYRRRRGAAQA